jgi:hypothetical protein
MTPPTEVPGARPDHRPRKGFWARFSEQETGPQKVLVGLAGTMTALATTIGGIYALTNVVDRDPQTVATDPSGTTDATDATGDPTGLASEPASGLATTSVPPSPVTTAGVTLRPGQTLVAQGSPEADALVHAFLDVPGARTGELDVVILPEATLYPRPQWIMRLWYNCHDLPAGQPPGEDLCDSAMLVFDDASPSPTRFDSPRRIELRGWWADNRPSGLGYGAKGLEIYPVPAAS